ncbi:MAG: hypothetical protein ACRAVC_11215 [Trichormus sp.]
MAIGAAGMRIASGNPPPRDSRKNKIPANLYQHQVKQSPKLYPPVPNLKTRGSSWSKEVTNDNSLTSSASRASSADPNHIGICMILSLIP